MKIIAQIDDVSFILQATKDEIANALGWYSEYQMPERREGNCYSKKIMVGDEIQVSEMYQACQAVKCVADEIAGAITKHKALIKNLEVFSAAINPATEIVKSKEPKK